jgi:hypothetical protein
MEEDLSKLTDIQRASYWEKAYSTLKKDAEKSFIHLIVADALQRGQEFYVALEKIPVHTLTCMGVAPENVDILFKGQLKRWIEGVRSYEEHKGTF